MLRKGITEFYVLGKGTPKTQSLLERWRSIQQECANR